MAILEEAMHCYTNLETKLLGRMRFNDYHRRGLAVLQNFDRHASEVVFMSIDFEGQTATNFGIATLCDRTDSIRCMNYALKKDHCDKFVFGDSVRVPNPATLRRAIIDEIQSRKTADSQIVLVGHGVRNELDLMELMNIDLCHLPVVGVIDTHELFREAMGYPGKLRNVLSALNIPFRIETLHCAGNDAHYTLRAFLALLIQKQGPSARWEDDEWADIIRGPRLMPKVRDRAALDMDWDEHLDFDLEQV